MWSVNNIFDSEQMCCLPSEKTAFRTVRVHDIRFRFAQQFFYRYICAEIAPGADGPLQLRHDRIGESSRLRERVQFFVKTDFAAAKKYQQENYYQNQVYG